MFLPFQDFCLCLQLRRNDSYHKLVPASLESAPFVVQMGHVATSNKMSPHHTMR